MGRRGLASEDQPTGSIDLRHPKEPGKTTHIALFGAGGKMGVRLLKNLMGSPPRSHRSCAPARC